jgi:predicted DNA-binding protein
MTAHQGPDDMRLQVDVSEEIKTRLKLHAVRTDKTMSELVEEALKEYLDKKENIKVN